MSYLGDLNGNGKSMHTTIVVVIRQGALFFFARKYEVIMKIEMLVIRRKYIFVYVCVARQFPLLTSFMSGFIVRILLVKQNKMRLFN